MKRFRWISIATFFIVVSSLMPLALTSPAQADSGKINLKELTNGADSILVGTVVERSSYWNEEHTQIYTSVAFSIDDRLKDTTNQDRVTITFLGGEAEGIGAWVSDMPSFDEGEEAMVFLKKLAKTQMPETKAIRDKFPQDEFEVYDGYRGKFAVNGGKIGNLSAGEFKGRVNSILSGQAIPDTELYVTPTPSTSPYLYNGYSWPHPPAPVVSYRINENTSDCTGEGVAVQNAAATWSVPANFTFSYAGTTTRTSVGYDLENDILWVNLGSISTIARATWWYMEVDGTIVETDIEFNDYYSFSASTSCPSGYYDVETIALHEMGHWLNLGDLYGAGDADKVMYGYGSTGTTKRVLHSDDIAGIQSIYGASAPNGTEKLVGADDAACGGNSAGDYFCLFRFQAVATGNINTFKFKSSGSGNVKVAVYSDISGQPGTLLNAVNTSTPVVPGWNDINISSTPIVAGNYYWLAHNSNATIACRYPSAGTPMRYKQATFSTFTFPTSAGTSFTSYNGFTGLIAGWEVSSTPAAPMISYSPSNFSFSATEGGSNPPSQTLNIWNSGGETLNWSVSDDAAWLSLSPGSGSSTGETDTVTASIDISGMTDGTYNATITISAAGATNTPQTAPVSLIINPVGGTSLKLVGADDATCGGNSAGDYFCLFRFQAVATGNINTFKFKSSGSGNVKVAVYSDISGQPGTLLNAVNTSTPVVPGWNDINISSTPIVAGNYYWLAHNSNATIACRYPSAGTPMRYKQATFSTFTFPTSAGTSFTSYNGFTGLIAGWSGSGLPPAPPEPPSLLSPGSAITFKWVTSTGATTYWLQVNTTSAFTGTDMFDAEVGNVTSQEVTGLSLGTTYYWRVKAGNASGWSGWSSARSVVADSVP